MSDADDGLPPLKRPAPDERRPLGRIEGRDKRKYARLWRIELDWEFGEDDFDVCCKMMWCDWAKSNKPHLDLEEFAAAWMPPTESEMIEEEIAERIAEERRQRESDPGLSH
jgi:hypothetical protein